MKARKLCFSMANGFDSSYIPPKSTLRSRYTSGSPLSCPAKSDNIPMFLMPPALPRNTRLLELLHLRNPLPVHLLILPVQPEAQDDAADADEETERPGNPQAFAVQGRVARWEDVRAQEWAALSQRGQDGVAARASALGGVDVGDPGEQ